MLHHMPPPSTKVFAYYRFLSNVACLICFLLLHSDFLLAPFFCPNIINCLMCSLSIHSFSSFSHSLSKMAVTVCFLSILVFQSFQPVCKPSHFLYVVDRRFKYMHVSVCLLKKKVFVPFCYMLFWYYFLLLTSSQYVTSDYYYSSSAFCFPGTVVTFRIYGVACIFILLAYMGINFYLQVRDT